MTESEPSTTLSPKRHMWSQFDPISSQVYWPHSWVLVRCRSREAASVVEVSFSARTMRLYNHVSTPPNRLVVGPAAPGFPQCLQDSHDLPCLRPTRA